MAKNVTDNITLPMIIAGAKNQITKTDIDTASTNIYEASPTVRTHILVMKPTILIMEFTTKAEA